MPEASLNDRDQYKHGVNLLSQFFTQSLHSRCWLNHSESVTREHALQVWSVHKKVKKQQNGRKATSLTRSLCAETKNSQVLGPMFVWVSPPPLSSIEELRKVKHDMDLSSLKFLRHWLCTFHRC